GRGFAGADRTGADSGSSGDAWAGFLLSRRADRAVRLICSQMVAKRGIALFRAKPRANCPAGRRWVVAGGVGGGSATYVPALSRGRELISRRLGGDARSYAGADARSEHLPCACRLPRSA